MRYIKLFFLFIVTVAFVVFAIVNRETVSISLWPLPYFADLPKFMLAIACFALGAIAGGMTMSLRYARSKRLLRNEQKRAQALQDELRTLRAEQSSLPAIGAKHP